MNYAIGTDAVIHKELHVLVGFQDHDVNWLAAVTTMLIHTNGSAISGGNVAYLSNVLCRQEAAAATTYVAFHAALTSIWDKLVNYQLVTMSWLATDLDVNFLNE